MKIQPDSLLVRIIIKSPLKGLYEERLIREYRLLFVNWVFQRMLGINGDVPWSVHYTSRVTNPDQIFLGKLVKKSFAVSGGCYIQAGNGIYIGEGTIFAPGIKIISADHDVNTQERQWIKGEPVRIGNYCWIGANAVILPGVELGEGVVVGAGAVVTHSFPGHVVIAGVPARIVKDLNNL